VGLLDVCSSAVAASMPADRRSLWSVRPHRMRRTSSGCRWSSRPCVACSVCARTPRTRRHQTDDTTRGCVYRSETRPWALTCDFVRCGIDDWRYAAGHDPVVRICGPSSGTAADHPVGAVSAPTRSRCSCCGARSWCYVGRCVAWIWNP